MPPGQRRVPVVQFLLREPTDAQYSTMRNILYHFIVSIGYYHLWAYEIPDRGWIWMIIFRIVRIFFFFFFYSHVNVLCI